MIEQDDAPVVIWLGMKYFLIYWLKDGSDRHHFFTREEDVWDTIEKLKKNPDLAAFELYEAELNKRWDAHDYGKDEEAAAAALNAITR